MREASVIDVYPGQHSELVDGFPRAHRLPVPSCRPMELTKGANTTLSGAALEITVAWASAIEGEGRVGLDICALRLGADARVREDTDFVFFNMPATPDGSVRHCGPATDAPVDTQGETILVELSAQPTDVSSIVITATIDVATPDLTFSGIPITATVRENGSRTATATFVPPLLTTERALTVLELYRRNGGWKLRAIGQGYASGLAGIATDFGVDVDAAPEPSNGNVAETSLAATTPPVAAERMPIDMRKRLDLRKRTVSVVLTKAGIAGRRARIAVVLDASGSMFRLYLQGTMARVVERLAAVAAHLDGDATLDVWSYATNPLPLPPLHVDALAEWIPMYVRNKSVSTGAGGARATKQRETAALAAGQPVPDWSSIGGQNDEAKVMQLVLDHYQPMPSPPPVLVVFITDGGLYRSKQIEKLLRSSSSLPVFWQFVGVGKASYGVLEKLGHPLRTNRRQRRLLRRRRPRRHPGRTALLPTAQRIPHLAAQRCRRRHPRLTPSNRAGTVLAPK